MIFVLDILLIFNMWLALKYSKYLFSPPILMGIGMLAASLFATLFYKEWRIYDFSIISVICIGFGTLIFTITCIILKRKYNESKYTINIEFNKDRCLIYLIISIIYAFIFIRLKQDFYISTFGSKDLAEVANMVHVAGITGDDFNKLPPFLSKLRIINILISCFSYFIISYSFINKWGYKYYIIGFIYFVAMVYNGFVQGTKADMLEPFLYICIMSLYLTYLKKRVIYISLKKIAIFAIAIFALLTSFQSISQIIGRESQADANNLDLVAEYLGAEIKNFDLVVQDKAQNTHSQNPLGYTLANLYDDLNIRNTYSYNYMSVGNSSLGNVYTQYYCYYMDLGIKGCLLLPILAAFVVMLLYNMMIKSLENGKIYSFGLFLYSAIAYSIFMSFFDGYILKRTISFNFLRLRIIYFGVLYFIIMPMLLKKRKRRQLSQ